MAVPEGRGARCVVIGHYGYTADFRGGIDRSLSFLFLLPKWAVADLLVREGRSAPGTAVAFGAAAPALLVTTTFVAAAT